MKVPSGFKLKSILKDDVDVYIVRAFCKKRNLNVILNLNHHRKDDIEASKYASNSKDINLLSDNSFSCKRIGCVNDHENRWDIYEDRGGKLLSSFIDQVSNDITTIFYISLRLCDVAKFMISNSIDIHKLNPDNILVDDNNILYLLDSLPGKIDRKFQLIYEENYITYIPPEVILSVEEIIKDRSFVYTLGAILFRFFFSRPHVQVSSANRIIRSLLTRANSYENNINKKSSYSGLYSLIKNTLNINPARRYSSIKTLKYDLLELSKYYSKHGEMNGHYSPSSITLGTVVENASSLVKSDQVVLLSQWLRSYDDNNNVIELQGDLHVVKHLVKYLANSHSDFEWIFLGKVEVFDYIKVLVSIIDDKLAMLKELDIELFNNKIAEISSINSSVINKDDEEVSISLPYLENQCNDRFAEIKLLFDVLYSNIDIILVIDHANSIHHDDFCENKPLIENIFKKVIFVNDISMSKQSDFETLQIESLDFSSTENIVSKMLGKKCSNFEILLDIIFEISKGIPKLVETSMRELYDGEYLSYQFEDELWFFDIDSYSNTESEVNKFELDNIELKNNHLREILNIASCLLESFTFDMLSSLVDGNGLNDEDIIYLIENNFIYLNQHTGEMHFCDDLKRKKIYSNLSIEKKLDNHYKIARLLARSEFKPKEHDYVCEHIVSCYSIVEDNEDLEIFRTLVEVSIDKNMRAGKFESAKQQYNTLLFFCRRLKKETEDWKYLQYGAAKVHCYCYDYDGMMKFIDNITRSSSDLNDKIECTLLKGNYYTLCSDHSQAMELCHRCLAYIGYDIAETITLAEVIEEISGLSDILDVRELEYLAKDSSCNDQNLLYLNRIIEQFLGSLLITDPVFMSYLVTRLIRMMYDVHQFIITPAIFTTFGLAIVRYTPFSTLGYSIGDLGVRFAQDANQGIQRFRAVARHCYAVRHFALPVQSSLEQLFDAAISAKDAGDIEYAAINMEIYCINSFISGSNLSVTNDEVEWGISFLIELGQDDLVKRVVALHNLVSFLIHGEGLEHSDLSCFGHYSTQQLPSSKDQLGFPKIYCYEVIGNVLMGNFDRAFEAATHNALSTPNPPKTTLHLFYEFFCTLTLISKILPSEKNTSKWSEVSSSCEMFIGYAEHCPENFMAKAQIIQSSLSESKGMLWQAWQALTEAQKNASQYGNLFEQALTAELSSLFWERQKNSDLAHNFAFQAASLYESWGALCKANQIKQYLFKKPKVFGHDLYRDSDISLDLEKDILIKANKIISDENDLNTVAYNILNLLIDSTGADSASLVMRSDEEKYFLFRQVSEESNLSSLDEPCYTLDLKADETEKSIFEMIEKTRSPLISGDIKNDDRINKDKYLEGGDFLSLVAIPIFYKSQYRGVISLLSLTLRNMFSSNTVDMLLVLASHISFALENAKMFNQLVEYSNDLENIVNERTLALEQTIEELKQTQEKLVEKEKMLELGMLVSGVAHEINTPLGIILTANSIIDNETQSIQSEMSAGTLTSTGLANRLEQVLTANNLTTSNIKRITRLIDNFKAMAVDTGCHIPVKFSLKDMITQFVNKYELDNVVSAKVTIDIDEKFELITYYELLGVVITNVFENSIQHGVKSMSDGEIIINAEKIEDKMRIVVKDNGCGINAGDEKKVFSPFYTTNRGGQNTGLGLTLVFNLVTRILGGEIYLSSRKDGQWTSFNIVLPLEVANFEK